MPGYSELIPRLNSCLQCGYSLRGLEPDRPCPECGFAYEEDTIYVEIDNTLFLTGKNLHRSIILYSVIVLSIMILFDGFSGALVWWFIGLLIAGVIFFNARSIARFIRKGLGLSAVPPLRVFAFNDEGYRVYHRGKIILGHAWEQDLIVELGAALFHWTLRIDCKENENEDRSVTVSINASRSEVGRIREAMLQRIELTKGRAS